MKILLLSHGSFAKGLYESCTMIMGKQSFLDYICLDDEGLEAFTEKIQDFLKKNTEETIYFLFDLKHGTPYNQVMIELLNHQNLRYELITGVNLPMVLSLSMNVSSENDKDDYVEKAMKVAIDAIDAESSNKGGYANER